MAESTPSEGTSSGGGGEEGEEDREVKAGEDMGGMEKAAVEGRERRPTTAKAKRRRERISSFRIVSKVWLKVRVQYAP